MRSRGGRPCLGLSLWLIALCALASPASGADAADAAAANSALAVSKSISSQNLRSLLDGQTHVSVGVSDLRKMQSHVRKLVEQVKKCTVGVQVGPAWGSGVIISKDGYVLTAAHVADAGRNRRLTDVEEGSEEAGVAHFKLADGREVKGKRLGLFRTQDAGLMKITDPGEYPFAPLAKDVNLNQWCIALGHPGGYQADRGLVLRLGRVLHVDDKAITTDCTLVGGDSGGPLFDMNGRVIGINSRISENLTANMHVPVSTYNDGGNWERMVKGDVWGRLPGQDPAWLGVRGEKDSRERELPPSRQARRLKKKGSGLATSSSPWTANRSRIFRLWPALSKNAGRTKASKLNCVAAIRILNFTFGWASSRSDAIDSRMDAAAADAGV